MRIGKFMENKLFFRDVTTGRRGIQWTQGRRTGFYRLCWFSRVTIPHREMAAAPATVYGGSTRHGFTGGGHGQAYLRAGYLTYASSIWGHGINNVVGAFAQNVNRLCDTVISISLLNATTVYVNWGNGGTAGQPGFTGATGQGFLFVWGATQTLY